MSHEHLIRLGDFVRCYKFGQKLVNIHSIVFLAKKTVWRNDKLLAA